MHLGKHHLLHGKIVNLPRPLAIIRRADSRDWEAGSSKSHIVGGVDDENRETFGEQEDDAPELEMETQPGPSTKRSRLNPRSRHSTTTANATTSHSTGMTSISSTSLDPFVTSTDPTSFASYPQAGESSPPTSPPSRQNKNRDYSSDLSSPVRPFVGRARRRKGDGGAIPELGTVEEREPVEPGEIDVDIDTRAEVGKGTDVDVDMDKTSGDRTNKDERDSLREISSSRRREYKVVGVVRKKVVFALR